MSVWKKIDGNGDDLMASNGIPGDEPLKVDVAVAPAWNNRTRVSAWNDNVGIEIMVDPAGLAELIDRLTEAQAQQVMAAAGCTMTAHDEAELDPDTVPA